MLSDSTALISDLEQDYKKLSNECKKKYNIIREVIDISMKAIEKLITISKEKEKFTQELALSFEILIKPIMIITESKHIKLYYYSVIIIKKLVTYNFVPVNAAKEVINIVKELFDNSSEEIQLKILETLQSMINSNKIAIDNDSINNILSISCKMFSVKSVEFKNPIKLLLKTVIKVTFEQIYNDKANKEKISTGIEIIKTLLEIVEGKKKEWIAPSMYSKCLGIELLSTAILTSSNLFIESEECANVIKNEILSVIQKILPITNDLIVGAKLMRLSLIIISKVHICYDLIETILKFAERDNLSWQKIIGLEGLCEMFNSTGLLFHLFKKNKELYEKTINRLTDITYKNVIVKKSGDSMNNKKSELKKGESTNSKMMKTLHNDSILVEGDSMNIPISFGYLFKLLCECYVNLKNSFVQIMEDNELKVNIKHSELTKEQNDIKNFIQFQYFPIKGALIGLLINSTDEGTTQNYLNIFQSLITIYGSISLGQIRDEYLSDLCNLALPNNLENFYEMKEKNIFITRTIFNMAHCVNLLDYSSWLLLLDIIQTLYNILIKSQNYILKPEEQFDIDIISSNLEMNIKKYSYDTPSVEIHEIMKKTEANITFANDTKGKGNSKIVSKESNSIKKKNNSIASNSKKQLSEEEKENMIILSTVIDTIFIDSNLFDEKAISDITKAFKDSSTKLIQNIEKTPQNETNKTFLQFNLIKMLELSIINIKRIELVWDNISGIIEELSMKNIPNISRFSIDILGIIIMFSLRKFRQRKTSEADNTKEDSDDNKRQQLLFNPLIKLITTEIPNKAEINESIIINMTKVLQKSGTFLNKKGWSSFIEILCYLLSVKENTVQFEKIFKIIEEIFNEYLSYLSIENIEPMINILEQFALSKQNDNISYSAIALFFSCANIAEKFQKLSTDQVDYYKQKWSDIFNKLSNLNKDDRYDIRKSGINVFAQIFEAKIKSLSELNIIEQLTTGLFFDILSKNYHIYEDIRAKEENKEWEDTIIISLQGVGKVFRSYMIENKENKVKVFEQLMKILFFISQNSTPEIKIIIIKILIEIPSYEDTVFVSHFNLIINILDEISNYLITDTFIKKYSTFNIGSKLILFVLDGIKHFFVLSKENKSLLSNDEYIQKMFLIIGKLMNSSKFTEGNFTATNPSRLLRNEKEIFDYIDELIKVTNDETCFKQIYKFLSSFIKKDENDKHAEILSHRALESMESIFNNNKLNLEFKVNK